MALFLGTAAFALAAGDRKPVNETFSQPKAIDRIDPSRPWQHDDGRIEHGGRLFDSWEAWRQANLEHDHRCAAPSPSEAAGESNGFEPFGSSDCDLSRTNPTDDYDPSQEDLVIPVVFHIISNDDGSIGSIDYQTVVRQLKILNDDFNGVGISSDSDSAASRIRFALASTDPNGDFSLGVTWTNNSLWFNDQGEYWESLAWDPTKYLNVYTTTAGGNFGYVPFLPSDGPVGDPVDRVVIAWNAFGASSTLESPKDLGRTLTHEVGHYLGLLHTFEGGCGGENCLESGDLVCDTPSQATPTLTCWGLTCDSFDPVNNFMNYSWEICMGGFTDQQTRRMRCTLQTYRSGLARPTEWCNYACPTDFNRDGVVNGEDLGTLLGAIGDSSETVLLCSDLNLNGTVGAEDFGILLASWGDCSTEPCSAIVDCEADECSIAYCSDGECRFLQIPFCENCGDPESGSCYEPTGTPGCDDLDCCFLICNIDPFCSINWDSLCSGLANSGQISECSR